MRKLGRAVARTHMNSSCLSWRINQSAPRALTVALSRAVSASKHLKRGMYDVRTMSVMSVRCPYDVRTMSVRCLYYVPLYVRRMSNHVPLYVRCMSIRVHTTSGCEWTYTLTPSGFLGALIGFHWPPAWV